MVNDLRDCMVVHPHIWYYRVGHSGDDGPSEAVERLGLDDRQKEELFSLYSTFLDIASLAEP